MIGVKEVQCVGIIKATCAVKVYICINMHRHMSSDSSKKIVEYIKSLYCVKLLFISLILYCYQYLIG